MPGLPAALQKLVDAFHQLPGIGPRSAERIALFLTRKDPEFTRDLAESLQEARLQITHCSNCGALTSIEADPCPICTSDQRDSSLLCIVEQPTDLLILEKPGAFHGKYHVLGGRISPINGIGPEDLRIAQLEQRLQKEEVKEVVLALGSDVEGDATSHYLAQLLRHKGVRVTRLAQGLPAGGGLEYADEITISRALEGRREF